MKAEFLARLRQLPIYNYNAGPSRPAVQPPASAVLLAIVLPAIILAGATLGQAQAPSGLPVARLTSVFPPGGQRGTTVELTVVGTDLEDAATLQFSDPAITAVPKTTAPGLGQTEPQPVAGQFLVNIRPEAKLGVHDVRVVGKYGISTPRAFVVGTLPETVEAEPNNNRAQATPISVGSTVNGRSNGAADQDYFKFTAKKGQRLTFDCWAYRIDSRMDATLVLFDAGGAELARNRDTNRFDPLLDVVIPADGDYYLLVYDFLYGGSNDHFYRVSVSAAPYIDYVMPAAGHAGKLAKFTLYGCNLPGGRPSPVLVEGKPLEMLEVQVQMPGDAAAHDLAWVADVEPDESGLDGIEYHLDSPQGPSNSVVLGITNSPVVVEQEPNGTPEQAQRVTTPCEICGQFNPRRDQDWYTFEAKKGDVFWIEIYSERLGEPTDPFLLVQQVAPDAQGKPEVKELQAMDDAAQPSKGQTALEIASEDPAYRFVAPADGMVRVLVRNLYYTATGDPRHVYRLAIHPPQPDFRLVAVPRTTPSNTAANQDRPNVDSPVLRRGGAEIVDIHVHRRDGFDDEVTISAAGLPSGVTAQPLIIPAGRSSGDLVLAAADNAPQFSGTFEISGSAKIGQTEVTRQARGATLLWLMATPQAPAPPRARLARALPLAVLPEEAPYTLEIGPQASLEVSRAGKLKLPIKVIRRSSAKDKIALQAFGLPKEIQAPAGNIDANATDGSLELIVAPTVKPGAYSFSVVGISNVDYVRNPEALETAKARQAAVEKIVAERTAAAKTAAEAQKTAEQKAAEAAQAVQKATEAQQAAGRMLAEADSAAKAAADQAKAAQETAAKDTGNQALAEARQAAEQRLAEATAKSKQAVDTKTAADKALADAAAAVKAANDAKAAATTAATAATANLTAATTFQQSFNQTVADLTGKTKPSKIGFGASSPGITLKVADAPITLTLAQPAGTGHTASKLEVPVAIVRLPDYKEPVQVRVKAPPTAGKVIAAPLTIAAGQDAGTLTFDITGAATPGQHKFTIEAVAKLGGQELIASGDFTLTVEKAEPEKK